MQWTKLDGYDYTILPGTIRVNICSTNDPDLVDIMSEISRSEGHIYVEGRRFTYLDEYRIVDRGRRSFIELDVIEMQ